MFVVSTPVWHARHEEHVKLRRSPKAFDGWKCAAKTFSALYIINEICWNVLTYITIWKNASICYLQRVDENWLREERGDGWWEMIAKRNADVRECRDLVLVTRIPRVCRSCPTELSYHMIKNADLSNLDSYFLFTLQLIIILNRLRTAKTENI